MSLPYYSISSNSNSYKCNLCTGFTQLQKNEEFTDLTLAADGHIIHVHKNIIALASPYLRDMLKSLPSQSPVVFLNKVSHKVLSHILEYIYQGEANVPADTIDAFIQASKSLHIVGIEDMLLPRKETLLAEPTAESSGPSNIAAHISIGNDHTMQIESYPRGGELSNEISCDEPDSAVGCFQIMKPKESLLPKPTANSSGERLSHIAAHISIGNDRTMQIQSFPHNDINSEIVDEKDGAFKEHNPETVVNETHDLPIINTESDNMSSVATRKKYGERKKIKRLTQRKHSSRINNTPQNVKNTGTTQKILAIDIHKDNNDGDQHSETAPRQYHDYNFIVKKQYDTEQDPLATPNTPVIEIQPITLESQDKQSNAIPVLVDTAQYEMVTDQDNIHIQMVNKDQIASNPDKNLQPMDQNRDDANITKIEIIAEKIIHTTTSSNTELAPDTKISSDAAEEPLQSITISDMTDFKGLAQFSMSERGVLQLILNRFIYNCHHIARGGIKRRFRCIAYRMSSCPAFVDTLHGAIVARKGIHTHPYHDDTIYKKHKKGMIYFTMKQAVDDLDKKRYR